MIIKNYEINKTNFRNNKFILLYGSNEGHKNEVLNIIKTKLNISQISKFDEKQILDNSEILLNQVLSKSLFDNEKIIFINRASEKLLKILNEIIIKKNDDLWFIIDSGPLEKKSKLRNMFEKEKDMICIAFYNDNNETLSKLASDFFKKKKLNISQSNINSLIGKCGGDRGVLKNELIKIEYFFLNKKEFNLDSLIKLVNLYENHSINELIDNCLAKNKRKTINILNENIYTNDDCIMITRTFLNKVKKIQILAENYKENKNLNLTISLSKPPIFWKDKGIVEQQLKKWSPDKLKMLIYKLSEIELRIKKNMNNSINLVRDFILNVASSGSNN